MVKVFYKTTVSYLNLELQRIDVFSILQEKTKKKNLRVSTCCSEVRDLSPHTSQQGNPGLIPIGEEKTKTNLREYKNHKCIRVKISKIKLMACQSQGLNTTIFTYYLHTI